MSWVCCAGSGLAHIEVAWTPGVAACRLPHRPRARAEQSWLAGFRHGAASGSPDRFCAVARARVTNPGAGQAAASRYGLTGWQAAPWLLYALAPITTHDVAQYEPA